MATKPLFGLPVAPEFRIDQGMIAMLDAKALGQAMRAVGEIEPFFGEREQMAFIGPVFGAACQVDRLCRVLSIVVFFSHGRNSRVGSQRI